MKNILHVLSGEKNSHCPIWLMRQAGRYLPEYREARAKAGSFMQLCFTPEYAADVTLQPIRRFGMDGAILFSDILVVPYSLGYKLDFVEGEGPQLERVEKNLPVFNEAAFFERSQNIFETVRRVRGALPEHVSMIGFAGSVWTVACYMMGGKGKDEFKEARARAHADPMFFNDLLNVLVDATAFYLIQQVKAGAEVLQLFDSWSGLVPDDQFHDWVIEPTRKIVAKVRAVYPHIPIIGFPRMAGKNILPYAKKVGVNALSLDETVDMPQMQKQLGGLRVQGNLAPEFMRGDKTEMLRAAEKILQKMEQPFIFNLGHGLTPEVPPENVGALVEFVQGYRKQERKTA